MLYLLDTADPSAIARLVDLYPLAGVTTNPSLISRQRQPFRELILTIRSIIGQGRQLHVQVVGTEADDMVREAAFLAALSPGEFYAKVPVTPQGLKAIRLIRAAGINVTATAVFTAQQAVLAARAGANYTAPYVNRLDNIQADGAGVVAEMVQTFRAQSLPAQVLAASFKNASQVQRCCAAGAGAVTVAPEILEALLAHPLTADAVSSFERDWESVYGKNLTNEM